MACNFNNQFNKNNWHFLKTLCSVLKWFWPLLWRPQIISSVTVSVNISGLRLVSRKNYVLTLNFLTLNCPQLLLHEKQTDMNTNQIFLQYCTHRGYFLIFLLKILTSNFSAKTEAERSLWIFCRVKDINFKEVQWCITVKTSTGKHENCQGSHHKSKLDFFFFLTPSKCVPFSGHVLIDSCSVV